MKRCIILILICITILIACNYQENIVTESDTHHETIIVDNETVKSASLVSTGGISSVNITYPYFEDHSDDVISEINRNIYEAVIIEDMLNYKNYREDIYIDYEIKHIDKKVLSILFSGYVTTGSSYNDFERAININTLDGNVLNMGYFFTEEELRNILDTLIEGDACTIIDKTFNTLETKKILREQFDSLLGEENSLLLNAEDFYISEGKVGLIGDCLPSMRERIIAEVDIDKSPIEKHLKTYTTSIVKLY